MAIRFDDILIKNWVRTHAYNVNAFYMNKPRVMTDYRMWYYHPKDTLHYKAVVENNFDIYSEYIETAQQNEHSVEKFKALIKDWDVSKMDNIIIKMENGHMVVNDGVHRLVLYICNHGGEKCIPSKYLNITFDDETVKKIGDALMNTAVEVGNGWSNNRTKYGYHSFDIFNVKFTGQRNPNERLNIMRRHYSFENKYVVDIGCNTGGMLFHCTEISKGIGIDFDKKCLEAAEVIKRNTKLYEHLDFIQRDLDKDNIDNIFANGRADVVFLLSLGSWIKKWRELYTLVMKNTNTVFLETNNTSEGVAQLDLFRNAGWDIQMISSESKDDITNNHRRQTYLIKKTIVCMVYGGLGNQLFQAVAGYLVNRLKGMAVQILQNHKCKHRTKKYDYYKIFLKNFGDEFIIDSDNFLDIIKKEYKELSPKTPYMIWNIEHADPRTILCGFYQYYPYIEPYENDIRDKLLSSLGPFRAQLVEKYDFKNRIFLHVRRGDYINNKYHAHNGIDNYYSKAYSVFKQSIEAPIFVISDDVDWLRSEKFFQNENFEIFHDDEVMTLALMSLCTGGAICANSTFSWWGAFLGAYALRSRITVPRAWSAADTTNLIPKEWIII